MVRLVGGLAHESNDVRARVARLLRDAPVLSNDALDALAHVVMNDEGRAEQIAAVTLRSYASPRSAAAFRVGLDSFQLRVAEVSVDGLGLTGEAEDVADLLEIMEFRPETRRGVLRAVSRLAIRPFTSHKALRVWWAKNADTPQATWAREGFVGAGIELGDVDGDARIGALIDALEHDAHYIRVNALRTLFRETGERFGFDELAYDGDSPRGLQERRMALVEWREWFAGR